MTIELTETGLWFLLALWCVVWAMYTGVVADSKGHPWGRWFWGGLFFGPIAMLAAVGIMPVEREQESPAAPRRRFHTTVPDPTSPRGYREVT